MKIDFEVDEETAEILKTISDKDKFLKTACLVFQELQKNEEEFKRYRFLLSVPNSSDVTELIKKGVV